MDYQAVIFLISVLFLGIFARSNGFFFGLKPAYAFLLFWRDADLSYPSFSVFVPRNSYRSAFRHPCEPRITRIGTSVYLTEIGYPVVGSDPVNVVQKSSRSAPIVDQPSHPMPFMMVSENCALSIAVGFYRKRLFPSIFGVPSLANCRCAEQSIWPEHANVTMLPREISRFWIIFKKLAHDINRGQIFVSHVVSPYVRGQGRTVFPAPLRPDFPSKNRRKQQVLGGVLCRS
jgi:hypothetical protein